MLVEGQALLLQGVEIGHVALRQHPGVDGLQLDEHQVLALVDAAHVVFPMGPACQPALQGGPLLVGDVAAGGDDVLHIPEGVLVQAQHVHVGLIIGEVVIEEGGVRMLIPDEHRLAAQHRGAEGEDHRAARQGHGQTGQEAQAALSGSQDHGQGKEHRAEHNARQQQPADDQIAGIHEGRAVSGEAHVGKGEELAVHIDVNAVDQCQHREGTAHQGHKDPPQQSGQHRRDAGEDQGPGRGEQPQEQVVALVDDPQVEEEILEPVIQGHQRQEEQHKMRPVRGLGHDPPQQLQQTALLLLNRLLHKHDPFFLGI